MKMIRNFEDVGVKERRIVAIASLPAGILFIMLFDYLGGVPTSTSIVNVCATILAGLAFALLVRILRNRGIDLWRIEKKALG